MKRQIYLWLIPALVLACVVLGVTNGQNTKPAANSAKEGGIQKKASDSAQSVTNAAKDFWALNMGRDGIAFNFTDVPAGTTNLKIARASSGSGPWKVVVNVPYTEDLPQPLVDLIDGTKASYYYRLQAFSKNRIVKTYGLVFVSASQD